MMTRMAAATASILGETPSSPPASDNSLWIYSSPPWCAYLLLLVYYYLLLFIIYCDCYYKYRFI
jgi:hypothetical protein